MRFSFLPKKVLIAGIVVAVAGGAAAVAVPVIAAHSHSAATAPTSSGAQGAALSSRELRKARLVKAVLRATVKETGLSRDALRQRLQAGQTIDQIAGDKAQAIENDVLSALKKRLDKAVAAGKGRSDQEVTLLAGAKTRIETLMSTNLANVGHGKHGPGPTPAASPSPA